MKESPCLSILFIDCSSWRMGTYYLIRLDQRLNIFFWKECPGVKVYYLRRWCGLEPHFGVFQSPEKKSNQASLRRQGRFRAVERVQRDTDNSVLFFADRLCIALSLFSITLVSLADRLFPCGCKGNCCWHWICNIPQLPQLATEQRTTLSFPGD